MATAPTLKEEILLYNNTVKLIFYPNSHRYARINGEGKTEYIKSVSSITGIIDKPFLKQWAVNMMRDYLLFILEEQKAAINKDRILEASKQWSEFSNEAKDIGTSVHDWLEVFVKNKIAKIEQDQPIPDEERVQNGILAFLNWYNSHDIEFIASEKFVYSKQHNYCGKLDNTFMEGGKRILGDFKTSKSIYAEYIMQVIGYMIAEEEESGCYYDGVCILRFDKETGEFEKFYLYKTEQPELFEVCKQAFLGALNLVNALQHVNKLLPNKQK